MSVTPLSPVPSATLLSAPVLSTPVLSTPVLSAPVLPEAEWRPRALAHDRRVRAWTEPYLQRRSRREPHPVEDFLWTYYSYRPGALRTWHPGWGATLSGDVAALVAVRGLLVEHDRAAVDPELPAARAGQVEQIRSLLVATQSRPARLGCFGLHEWAMVYRQSAEQVRHAQVPLRLGAEGTDAVVEGHRITCTHYDAYRFFTEAAVPLNTRRPTLATRVLNEQPGCLHAGMDLYKWAYKLAPITGAELIADCFELAREIRVLDMRASPYDLREWGYAPVRIETPDGKADYVRTQRDFSTRSGVLRRRLIELCDAVLAAA